MSYAIIDQDHGRVGKWIQHWTGGEIYHDGSKCIGLARRGELIAGTMYDSYNGCSINAHIVIQGPVTRHWLYWIFAYPFLQLKCNVILGIIPCDNAKSNRLVQRMGFTLNTIIPGAHQSGALCVYTMYRHQCRFIRGAYHYG